MKKINSAILEELSKFESATIQNAAIFVRGYVDLGVDYSGPELKCMLPESGTLVGANGGAIEISRLCRGFFEHSERVSRNT